MEFFQECLIAIQRRVGLNFTRLQVDFQYQRSRKTETNKLLQKDRQNFFRSLSGKQAKSR